MIKYYVYHHLADILLLMHTDKIKHLKLHYHYMSALPKLIQVSLYFKWSSFI